MARSLQICGACAAILAAVLLAGTAAATRAGGADARLWQLAPTHREAPDPAPVQVMRATR